MKVSIAMATYNGASYIEEQLRSFAVQTRPPDELVISDDGSTDETVLMLKRFKAQSPFAVRILLGGQRLGYAQNFDRALREATGDLVFLSDQDDYWFSNKIQIMERQASRHSDADVFMCDAALTDDALNEAGVTKIGQIESGGLPSESFVMGCCAAVRKEFLEVVLPVPTEFPSHDYWIVALADGVGRKVVRRQVLQYYRRHDQNESRFVANRTRTLTRLRVLKRRVWLALNDDGRCCAEFRRSIHKREQLVFGARRAAERSRGALARKFHALVYRFERDVNMLREREAIRSQGFVRRMFSVLTLFMTGGYSGRREWINAVRDLIRR